MYCNVGVVVRLCWTVTLLFPVVSGRFGAGGLKDNGLEGGSNRFGLQGDDLLEPNVHGGFGKGNRNGRPFGFQSQPNSGDNDNEADMPELDEMGEQKGQEEAQMMPEPEPVSMGGSRSSTGEEAVIAPVAPLLTPSTSAMPESIVTSVPAVSMQSKAAVPLAAKSSFVFGTSSFRAAIPPPVAATQQPSQANPTLSPLSSLRSITLSSSFQTTTATSTALPSVAENQEGSIAEGPGISGSARVVIGVGITFGILSIASVAGLYLYRRHRNRKALHSSGDAHPTRSKRSFSTVFPLFKGRELVHGFALLHRGRSCPKDSSHGDAEWSIESAECIEIVRGGSVCTVVSNHGGRESRQGVLSVGLNVPAQEVVVDKKADLADGVTGLGPRAHTRQDIEEIRGIALSSNPLEPELDAFPRPPGSPQTHMEMEMQKNDIGTDTVLQDDIAPAGPATDDNNATNRLRSWPLPD